MIEYIDYLLTILMEINSSYQILIIGVLYLFGPILVIPIMGVSYLAGFFFGFKIGIVFSIFGYAIATYLYYKFGRLVHKINFIRRKIVHNKIKYKSLYINVNFFGIVFLSLFIPFLPLVVTLGALGKRKRLVISGIIVGALPMTLISVYLGSIGKSFLETKDTKLAIFIIIGFVLIYFLGKVYKHFLKKRGYEQNSI